MGSSSRFDTDICIPAHVVRMEDICMPAHVVAQHIASSLVIFCQPFGHPPKILPSHAGEDQQMGRSAFPLNAARAQCSCSTQTIKQRLFSSDTTRCHRRCLGEKDSKGQPNTATHCTRCSSRPHAARVKNMTAFMRRKAVT